MAHQERKVSPPVRKSPPKLTYKQEAFKTAFLSPTDKSFLNATQAYKVASPVVTIGTAEVGGHRMLRDPKVAQAVEAELSTLGWTKERLERELQRNLDKAWEKGTLTDHRSATVDLAKLMGLWVEKSQVDTLNPVERDAIRDYVLDLQGVTPDHPSEQNKILSDIIEKKDVQA